MKGKFLTIMLMLLFTQQLFAQIAMDKTEADGQRIICTYYKTSGVPGLSFSLNSGTIPVLNDTIWELDIKVISNVKKTMSIGRKLLLKLTDDSIIELSNTNEIDLLDNEYELVGSSITYFVYPKYDISKSDLERIISLGVKKIRMEFNTNEYTMETKNKISKILTKAYSDIQNAYKVQKDIHSDF